VSYDDEIIRVDSHRRASRWPVAKITVPDMRCQEPRISAFQKLRQLGDVHGNPSRLILAEQLGCRASSRLILVIDVGKLLSVVVAHHEADRLPLDRPKGGRRRLVNAAHLILTQ
jgi:hypothetical protein